MENITNSATHLREQQELEQLLAKAEDNITSAEAERIRELWMTIKLYEQGKHIADAPTTLPNMVKLKMFELNIKPTQLAALSGMSKAKLSLVLSGKQKPDVAFLKAAHTHLYIDAEFILRNV